MDTPLNSTLHALQRTVGSSVAFIFAEKVYYPLGLYQLMEGFFKEIESVEVQFLVIHFEEAELIIAWQMYGELGELTLWQELDKLKRMVSRTCPECGEESRKQIHKGALTTLCFDCRKDAPFGITKTGTWLDYY